jgi:hypothetical protein
MSKSYDVDAAKARIRQVFQYLKEMHRVRMPPVIDLEDREWRLRLDTLPRSPHVERGFQFGSGASADDSGYGEFILKVGRPPEPECPEPSVVIANWLKQGWNRVDADGSSCGNPAACEVPPSASTPPRSARTRSRSGSLASRRGRQAPGT